MNDMQFGHDGRHHGCGTPECPTELHHHHDERCVSPLEERRQRAREAFYDDTQIGDVVTVRALDAAIETATRVRITPEIVQAAELTGDYAYVDVIKAAFEAAGFEVEQ